MNRTFDLPRLAVLCLFIAATGLLAIAAHAVDPVQADRRGVAIEGYDPVAYFIDGDAIEGSEEITADWNGATWHFASTDHRDAFAAAPEKYAPQFGGYCAWAVAQGKTAKIDPEAWKIVDGKLYLNYSAKIQRRWEEDEAGNIQKAAANWAGLID